jgi:hypothetical protein
VSVGHDQRITIAVASALRRSGSSVLHPHLLIDLDLAHRAKNVITSLLKRLVHRNPNVQIFALEVCRWEKRD